MGSIDTLLGDPYFYHKFRKTKYTCTINDQSDWLSKILKSCHKELIVKK